MNTREWKTAEEVSFDEAKKSKTESKICGVPIGKQFRHGQHDTLTLIIQEQGANTPTTLCCRIRSFSNDTLDECSAYLDAAIRDKTPIRVGIDIYPSGCFVKYLSVYDFETDNVY
jgi:hypothetical protein